MEENPYAAPKPPRKGRQPQADPYDRPSLHRLIAKASPIGIMSALLGAGVTYACLERLIFGNADDRISTLIYLPIGPIALWLSVRILRSAFIAEKEIRKSAISETKQDRVTDMLDKFDNG